MATSQDLNPSQLATLQLLLKQRRSYDEIAVLLKTSSSAVQTRAHEAVDALGPETPDIGADRRKEIADYLLGQQSASRRAATREYLEDLATGRSWARAVAGALRPIGGDNLPDVPAEPAEVDQASAALDRRTAPQDEVQRNSNVRTKLLVVAAALVVATLLIVSLGIFNDHGGNNPRTATVTRTTPPEVPVAVGEGVLRPPMGTPSGASGASGQSGASGASGQSGASGASGQMGIIQYPSTNRFKLLVATKGLKPAPKGSAYGVWLYTSKVDNAFVGFPKNKLDGKGVLDVVADLSPDTRTYREVLLTLERVERPRRPGTVVLRGVLRLVTPQQTQTPPRPQTQTQTQPG
jgi:hypothetical protein